MKFVLIPTSIATNDSMLSHAFSVAKNIIFYFGFYNSIYYCCTFVGAISSFAALICFSTRNYFSAYLARFSLSTRKRTINSICFSQMYFMNLKRCFAGFTNSFCVSRFVSAFFGAINLSNSTSAIVALKLSLANRASVHGDEYAVT